MYESVLYYNAEQILNSSIEYLTIDVIPAPYYITGHGEPSGEESDVLYTYSYVGFPVEEVDLSQSTALPEDASTLVINTPTSDLSDAEAAMLLAFLKNGGSLTLITNEANLDMPNLMSIMNAYGLSANKGFVSYDYEAEAAEAEASTEDTEATEGEEVVEELPDKNLVAAQINLTHDAFYSLEGYYATLFRANEIVISPDLRETAKATVILSTDEKCFIDGVENSTGAKTVAVMVEDGDTVVSWFTGADAFEGEHADMINSYISLYAVAWGVDNYDSELVAASPRLVSQEALSVEFGTALILGAIIIAVIPAAIAVAATVIIKKYKKAPKKELQD